MNVYRVNYKIKIFQLREKMQNKKNENIINAKVDVHDYNKD